MQRFLTVAACALALAACTDAPTTLKEATRPSFSTGTVALDPALTEALATATESDTFEVVLNFDETLTTTSDLTSAVLSLGAGVIQFKHLSMLAVLATPTQVSAIQTLPGVQSLYLNKQLRYLNKEGVGSINADDVHALGITGKGIGVAILDSGIDGLHPDLLYPSKTVANVKYIANVRDAYYFEGSTNKTIKKGASLFVDGVANSETTIGHGTHVAGTAAGTGEASGGKYKGVAPGASLVGIGAGDVLFIFWILAGFDYILDHQRDYNIKVVNNSWGSEGAFDPNDPINEATKEVYKKGITVVFAGGNSGPDQNTMNPYSVAPWVISVAAGCKVGEDPTNSRSHCPDLTNSGREEVLAEFSSRGIPGDAMYHPDVLAPGVHIVSVRASTGTVMNGLDLNHDARICAIDLEHEPYYTCASGTSMASPHVAGVVALLQEAAGSTLTPDQVLDVLVRTARPLTGYAEWEVGAGYVDALAAVKAVKK
jgi:serine protease AprX